LIPEKIIDIPRGQTVNLRLAYKLRDRAMQECKSILDFRVRIHPDWITARPISYTSGNKAGKEIEGIIAFGCVQNTTTNKVFAEIQAAIDDSETKDGHEIVVCPGTYVENVKVTKNGLTIRSRDGRDSTIVQAQNTNDIVLQIAGDNNTIDGFTIEGSNENGILIVGSRGNKITNNTITNNRHGIRLLSCRNPKDSQNLIEGNNIQGNRSEGVWLSSSVSTTIVNNNIAENAGGIYVRNCYAEEHSPNLIEGNNIQGNRSTGVSLSSSVSTEILNNTVAKNRQGIFLVDCHAENQIGENDIQDNRSEGVLLLLSVNTKVFNNTIAGNSEDGVKLVDSFNTLIFDNIISRNCRGINIKNTSSESGNNRIYGNSIWNNFCFYHTGIHLDGSSPEIIGNTISDDAGDGIECENGANPNVQKNNITNNTGFGLNNIDTSVNIDAQENWWGDASGPTGAGPGTGDEVSENVDFSNWRTEPVALVVTSGWDVHGAKGTDVTVTFYVAKLSDSNDTYDISVSDTLGWGLYPTTLTETVTAGQSNQILINVSIPLDVLNATEDEIILMATSTSNPTVTDSATLKVTVGEILMLIDGFSVGAPPLTVTNNEGVFPLKDGMAVQSPMILGGEFDAAINLLSAELGNGVSAEIRGGSLHYTQDASCTAVLIFHYDGNDGSWEQVHASTGLGGGIDITNGGTYGRIRVEFLNNVSSFVMGVVLFTDQDNSSEAKMTIPVSAEPFTVEYLFEGLVHQGNGADLTNVSTILFLAGSGGGMTGLMDFEIDGIWVIPADETPPPPEVALSHYWGFDTSYLLPRWWP